MLLVLLQGSFILRLSHSPVDTVTLFGRNVFIKRDDLLHGAFSGNKARKFAYFLQHDFPSVTTLVGYGSPQANSLYALTALAALKGWQLKFYVDHVASYIHQHPAGNYRAALALGAEIIDLSQCIDRQGLSCHDYIAAQAWSLHQDVLVVPEGGRCHQAQYGIDQLADEIIHWQQEQLRAPLRVVLPSGTGTTALYLQRRFWARKVDIQVYTAATVGGDSYLHQQFAELEADSNCYPKVVSLGQKYHYGKLYPQCLSVWQLACECGIEFDLLYDPVGLILLAQLLDKYPNGDVMYLHQGGLLGNETMLPRYQRKYPEKFLS